MTDLILTNAVVLTMSQDRRSFLDGYVWMKDGQIEAVGPMRDLDAPDGIERRDLGGMLVMPGLVNAHNHLASALVRGSFDEGARGSFGTRMFAALRALDGDASYAGALMSLAEQIQGGVTTTMAGEFGHRDRPAAVLRACRDAGMRVLFSRSAMNSEDELVDSQTVPAEFRDTPDSAVEDIERLRAEFDSDLISVVPEALSPMRVTPAMLERLAAYARERGVPFLMHLGAAQDEVDESVRRYGLTCVEFLDHLGVLGPKTLLGHAIYSTEAEIPLMAARDVAIAHCANGVMKTASIPPRVAEWIAAGLRVGLGTDAADGNTSQNLWETAKTAMLLQKTRLLDGQWGSAELALGLLTNGGARALYWEDRIGSLEPGKRADVICLDIDRPSLAPRETIVSSLVYANDRSAVRHVFIDGVERLRDGVLVSLDQRDVVALANREAERVLVDQGIGLDRRERSSFHWE
ncbi:MAG: amidohydrolase family protein [Dehalococcoidia bacterium]